MRTVFAKASFRAGPTGACKAHLFAFFRFGSDVVDGEPPQLIAAVSLLEAVIFLKRRTPEFCIRAAEHRGIIVLLSGSPYA